MSTGVHWVNIVVCGTRQVRVDVVSRLSGAAVGDMTRQTGVIRVKFAEASFMEDTLLHEITHSVWDASGLLDTIRRRFRNILTDQQLEDLEEDIIVLQTPGLLATLKQAGWLKLPAPPTKE